MAGATRGTKQPHTCRCLPLADCCSSRSVRSRRADTQLMKHTVFSVVGFQVCYAICCHQLALPPRRPQAPSSSGCSPYETTTAGNTVLACGCVTSCRMRTTTWLCFFNFPQTQGWGWEKKKKKTFFRTSML